MHGEFSSTPLKLSKILHSLCVILATKFSPINWICMSDWVLISKNCNPQVDTPSSRKAFIFFLLLSLFYLVAFIFSRKKKFRGIHLAPH